jgi:hypothetical protein
MSCLSFGRLNDFFGKGIPLATGWAFPEPLGRIVPTGLTEVGGFYLSQIRVDLRI